MAGGDAAEVLEAAEGALDEVAALVGGAIKGMQMLAARPVGDHGRGAASDQQAAERIAVVGAIGGECGGGGQQADQVRRDRCVAALARRNGEGDEPTQPVDQRVQLGRRATPRTAYGVGVRPPFPPVAQRCALAQVLSSISSAGGPPVDASVSNARCHTPFFAQRTQRL